MSQVRESRYLDLVKTMDENPIESDTWQDAWDEATQLAYENTFGHIPGRINPEAVPKMLHALKGLLGDVLDLLNKNDQIKLGTIGMIHIVQAKEAIALAQLKEGGKP